MSATIPESMRLDDLLKATGYDCPVDLQGKTFDQATGGGDITVEPITITENGVVTAPEGKAYSPITVRIGNAAPIEMYPWYWNSTVGIVYLSFNKVPERGTPYWEVDANYRTEEGLSLGRIRYSWKFSYTKIDDKTFAVSSQSGGYDYVTLVENTKVELSRLEANKSATIDVSAYTEPVEITPTQGKDGMKKATITLSNLPSSFFDTIKLKTDNPTYSKTLTKGATVYLNNKYVNMVARGGDVTETIKSIGQVFATVTYVNSTQVLTVTLNTSHPEASTGLEVKIWGE